MIKYIWTGDNGDATSNYNIITPNGMTIKEFIEVITKDTTRIWRGTFYLNDYWTEIGKFYNKICSLNKEYNDIIPTHIRASGGYGLMDYYFYTEE